MDFTLVNFFKFIIISNALIYSQNSEKDITIN